jgi:hypothetical protein
VPAPVYPFGSRARARSHLLLLLLLGALLLPLPLPLPLLPLLPPLCDLHEAAHEGAVVLELVQRARKLEARERGRGTRNEDNGGFTREKED